MSETEWVVNGQPTRVEAKRGDTVFSLASRAIGRTGNAPYWSPDTWEARCYCGIGLPWGLRWTAAMGVRAKGHASSCAGWLRKRPTVFLNLRAGYGG